MPAYTPARDLFLSYRMLCKKIIRNTTLVLKLLLLHAFLHAQDVPVFVAGAEGYRSFRIPAIIRLTDGTLLAFCEGRKNNAADFGDIDIVMKKSPDNGRSWSALSVIVDHEQLQAGNPAPVVDRLDPSFPGGRIFLFYNTGNDHEAAIVNGKGIRECHFITSSDGGQSWSVPVNITTSVHRPLKPGIHPGYQFPEDWRAYANTPGHATQIRNGKYRGRIFVAANHSAGAPKPNAAHYAAHGYFTDDHGQTFRLGETVSWPGSNESTAAPLSGGKLMMNMRNQGGHPKARIVALSSDGGATWDSIYADRSLPDPVCQGSLLELGWKKGKRVLAFCNAADTSVRKNLTLRISFNEGRTWRKQIPVHNQAGNDKGDMTAYSDLVKTGHRKVGVLYEKNNYREIVFRIVKW